VMLALEAHAWPGNVRELKNVVERAVAHWPDGAAAPIADIILNPFDSPFRPRVRMRTSSDVTMQNSSPVAAAQKKSGIVTDYKSAVAAFERQMLVEALDAARHNQRIAAKKLGLPYHGLRNAMRKHGLLPAQSETVGS
jgi:psp operon transcriptional activator